MSFVFLPEVQVCREAVTAQRKVRICNYQLVRRLEIKADLHLAKRKVLAEGTNTMIVEEGRFEYFSHFSNTVKKIVRPYLHD